MKDGDNVSCLLAKVISGGDVVKRYLLREELGGILVVDTACFWYPHFVASVVLHSKTNVLAVYSVGCKGFSLFGF